jgi:hypothetical protein
MAMNNAQLVLDLAAWVIWLWGFIELGFLRGTSGDDRFGPDPLSHREFGLAMPDQPLQPVSAAREDKVQLYIDRSFYAFVIVMGLALLVTGTYAISGS